MFHNAKFDVTVHGDDFVCLADEDGLTHIDSLLESKYAAKDMGSLGLKDSDATRLLLVQPCVHSWDRSKWTTLGH